jgi:hypothetical protein
VPLAEDSAAKLKRSQLNVCTVYVSSVLCILFPLWLKSEPGWPAISVSTSQLFRVGQIVWFGWLSAISQLASRGEGMGSWATLCLHTVTLYTALHYLAQVATAGRGVAFPPLGTDETGEGRGHGGTWSNRTYVAH